jgi:hypothetical protein
MLVVITSNTFYKCTANQYLVENPMEMVFGAGNKDKGEISRKKARHGKGCINLNSSPVTVRMKQDV